MAIALDAILVSTFISEIGRQCQLNGLFFPWKRNASGIPISAYLFILALEILFIQIKDNHQIKGIIIRHSENKYVT